MYPCAMRQSRRSAIPVVLACAVMTATNAPLPLDPVEQQIVAAVDRENDSAIALLETVVNINSGTTNLAGVRAVGGRFRAELDALGFDTRWVDGAAFNRAGHLVAEHAGSGPHILLVGHLDTVFDPDHPFQRFERISPTEARGPGIIDMKGGDVIIVHALKALKAADALLDAHISVIMTGDEEDVGQPRDLARRALRDMADAADVAIGFEDGPGDPRLAVIARRGSTGWTLQVAARGGHSSQIFSDEAGAGAIFEAARVLQLFRERLSHDPLLTFSPGVILGGTGTTFDREASRGTAAGKSNVIAASALVEGDVRAISPEQLASAKAAMQGIVAEALPHATSTIAFDDSYPPFAPTDGNRRLLTMYDQASRDTGAGPVTASDPRAAGAADISFAAGRVEMALDGIGLMGRNDHSGEETADLATLPSQTKRAAVLLYRLTREGIRRD
jgi:glutamate carboxypeptidase